ncbi:MAG: methyltransferase [Tenericutes bacterium]|nr:methyltransferase [Mycoplasmatota bacterium]
MFKEEIHDLLAYDGLKIIQRKDLFRFSLDSLLLADFVNINLRAKKIIDFGTGLGPIPLYLSLKTEKDIVGIDIQADAVALAKKSVELNHLENQIKIYKRDILEAYKDYETNSFDIITINPPFFKYHHDEFLNDLDAFTIARHEVYIDLEGIFVSARKMITSGGSLSFIHRANRLEEIILLLNKHGFVMKRIKFVYTKESKDAMMVLIDARANGNTGDLKIEKPLVIYDENNQYTEEVLKIFHLGDEAYEKKS